MTNQLDGNTSLGGLLYMVVVGGLALATVFAFLFVFGGKLGLNCGYICSSLLITMELLGPTCAMYRISM